MHFLCRGRKLIWALFILYFFIYLFGHFLFCVLHSIRRYRPYSNEGTTITQHRHEYITSFMQNIYITFTSRFMHNTYISFTVPLVLQSSYSILLPALGPLHLRIPRFPLELLVRDPLVEDRPATVRSNLKKGQYI